MNVNITNSLSLCENCGGTGVNPKYSTDMCPVCRGLKIINHFQVSFVVDKPYSNEYQRDVDESDIRRNIDSIVKHITR